MLQTILKKIFKSESKEIYNSLNNLPIGLFFRILETANIDLLVIKGKVATKEVEDTWKELYLDYQNKFGRNTEFDEYVSNLKKLIMLEIDFALTHRRVLLNDIEMLTIDIDEYLKTLSNEKQDNMKVVALIEKYLGFSIDLETCSVTRFYKYIEILNEENTRLQNEYYKKK